MSSGRSSGDPESIRQACELLINAQRPVILLGGGVVWSHANAEAMELGEFLFAPLVTSSGKSGVVPDDFPLSIGRLGNEANKVALQTVREADVVAAFGCTFNYRTTFALRQMGAEKWPSRVIQRIQEVWERKETWSNEWSRLARSSDVPIRRLRLLKDIIEEVERDGLVFGELLWKNCLKTSSSPLIESEDFPLSGAHLSLAMGAKLALPNRQVVAVLGDGQFMTAITDLATAVEHGIPVLVVVARNGCNGQAKAIQAQFYQGRYIGVDHPFPNLTDVALSLGAYGERVESPSEIRPAVRRGLESQKPSLIEVVVTSSIGDLKPVFG
jgi:thiamine pyrophosphate-dependent acetolactate synthase large subunit-like protein